MIDKKKKYKLGDFNYRLSKKFIAQYPERRRDLSRLMVVNRGSGKIEHKKFLNITDYMRKNDLMVVNKSGITIRISVADLRQMGRATQGVRIIKLRGEDSIAAVAKVPASSEEEDSEGLDNTNITENNTDVSDTILPDTEE